MNEITSFKTIWIDLEDIILSEIARERQILYVSLWNLKNTSEPV